MPVHRNERHRLTTLQRQLMKWLRGEGGGCLPADRLFTTMLINHPSPESTVALQSERFCEAVENLMKKGYAEVRDDKVRRLNETLSIYDFAPFHTQLKEKKDGFHWKKGTPPEIALTDEGTAYADGMS